MNRKFMKYLFNRKKINQERAAKRKKTKVRRVRLKRRMARIPLMMQTPGLSKIRSRTRLRIKIKIRIRMSKSPQAPRVPDLQLPRRPPLLLLLLLLVKRIRWNEIWAARPIYRKPKNWKSRAIMARRHRLRMSQDQGIFLFHFDIEFLIQMIFHRIFMRAYHGKY